MQFFGAGVPMRRVVRSRIKSDQHAYAVDFVFLASILTWIPGAASSHSGLTGASKGGTNGRVAASPAIRFASRPHSDAAGRNTSVGQPTNELIIARSGSISCRQSSHDEI